jgi:hypothetical protein
MIARPMDHIMSKILFPVSIIEETAGCTVAPITDCQPSDWLEKNAAELDGESTHICIYKKTRLARERQLSQKAHVTLWEMSLFLKI